MKQQKMKITGGTKGKFYRKSTPGSRIKEAAKKIGKTALNVLTGGKSLPLEAARTGFTKPSSFKMKKFSGFGNESPAKFDPKDMRAKKISFSPSGRINVDAIGSKSPRISTKAASAGEKAIRNFKNASSPRGKMATGKIGRKVAGKIGGKLLGPVGAGLAIKDAYGTYKDIKKGMKPGKAARKNFLGF